MRNTEDFDAGKPSDDLSEHDRRILDFAKDWWKYPGARDESLHQTFGFGPTTYFQRLNRLIDDPKAMEYDPTTVQRYQRIREKGMTPRRSRTTE